MGKWDWLRDPETSPAYRFEVIYVATGWKIAMYFSKIRWQ